MTPGADPGGWKPQHPPHISAPGHSQVSNSFSRSLSPASLGSWRKDLREAEKRKRGNEVI